MAIQNPVCNDRQAVTTDQAGAFRFLNVPLNNYRVLVRAAGFANFEREVTVRTTVPVSLDIAAKTPRRQANRIGRRDKAATPMRPATGFIGSFSGVRLAANRIPP